MRKSISIFFLSLYLLSVTEVQELLKLPLVVKHFARHHKENQDMNFWAFLDMHYMQGSPQDADYEQDMQLPFKNVVPFVCSMHTMYLPLVPVIALSHPKHNQSSSLFHFYRSALCVTYPESIWQPPRA